MELPKNCGQCEYLATEKRIDGKSICSHPDMECMMIITFPDQLLADCPMSDEVLDSVRFRIRYRQENFYVVVVHKFGLPVEVFAEHPVMSDPKIQYMLASWDTITRFVTLALKAYPLQKVVEQLNKSSRQKNDLPGVISELLQKWELGEYGNDRSKYATGE